MGYPLIARWFMYFMENHIQNGGGPRLLPCQETPHLSIKAQNSKTWSLILGSHQTWSQTWFRSVRNWECSFAGRISLTRGAMKNIQKYCPFWRRGVNKTHHDSPCHYSAQRAGNAGRRSTETTWRGWWSSRASLRRSRWCTSFVTARRDETGLRVSGGWAKGI